ncbi:TPM domain-containing protein [Tenacibaculum sp. UWU-22]|uniref:TPM domain-containing protein n=1 Tax=Tenacibaculum sp. UWU-22 TaxID=3234187 RepID=UPI0034DAF310
MSTVENFLSAKQEQEIVEAIRQAEQNTSGEIRVHIEKSSSISHYNRAIEVFYMLKMDNTKQQNAVLIYVAVDDCKFVIYGDKGINTIVPDNFWDTTKNIIQDHFKKQDFKDGIVAGVLKIGEQLKSYFPWSSNDQNELPNEISKG